MAEDVTGQSQSAESGTETQETTQETTKGATQETTKETPPGAPEQYADFTLPDGVVIDKGTLEAFLPIAKKLNLTQEGAQELINIQTGMVVQEAKAREEAFKGMLSEWDAAVKADPDMGGKNYDASSKRVDALIRRFGDAELVSFLGDKVEEGGTSLLRSPVIRKFLHRIAQAVSEDKPPLGEGGQKVELTTAQKFYGTDPK